MAPHGGGSQAYGFPIYCAAWLPLAHILKPDPPANGADAASSSSSADASPPPPMAILGGGGGEGRSGVPNRIVVAALSPAAEAAALSAEPVLEVETNEDAPYRMAVHPRGDGVFVAFLNGCSRLYRWDTQEGEEPHKLTLEPDQEALVELKDVGSQLTVSFSAEGSILATGGEDGHLRVFKWPAMGSVLTEADKSIKDLNISSDEKFLAVNRISGPCRVWDLQSSEVEANLPREAGEIFGFCRFCNRIDSSHILFIAAMQGDDYGKIISWNTTSWTRIGSKKITREAISAFAVSPDSALLAIGTAEGSIIVLGSKDMRTVLTVKKAHLGSVTTLSFSQDSRSLLSTSFDATARVTSVGCPKSNGTSIWPMLLVVILAILVYYYMQQKEDLLAMFWH